MPKYNDFDLDLQNSKLSSYSTTYARGEEYDKDTYPLPGTWACRSGVGGTSDKVPRDNSRNVCMN